MGACAFLNNNPSKVVFSLLYFLVHPNVVPSFIRNAAGFDHYDAIEKNKEDPSIEFPYPLVCQSNQLDAVDAEYSLILAYHVGMLNNWRAIAEDQLRTLDRCGLGRKASRLILSYSNGPASDILRLLEPYNFTFKIDLVESTGAPWEAAIMTKLLGFCRSREEHQDPTIVFYFHNKGCSRYTEDWRERVSGFGSYAKVLYWRKYLEYFTLERPALCIEEIVGKNASTCGANLDWNYYRKFYSGNFWSASCQYISSLQPVNMTTWWFEYEYLAAEMWLGGRFMNADRDKYVNLHENKKLLYLDLFGPEMYAQWDRLSN